MAPAKKVSTRFWVFTLGVTALYFCISVIPEICRLPVGGFADGALMAAYYLLIFLMQGDLMLLISLNRYIFAALFPLLITATAIMAYFFVTLNVTLTAAVVDLCLNNDLSTSGDFVTLPVVLTAVCALALGVGAAWVRFKVGDPSLRAALLAAVCAVCVTAAAYEVPRMKAMLSQRLPFAIEASMSEYLALSQERHAERHTFDGVAASCGTDSITVVLVIGESLRSDHLGLNGYERQTTPRLAAEEYLVSLPNITSTAFYTMLSIPRLMTRADDDSWEEHDGEQSFITLFKNAGFRTAWLANQEALATFAYFTEEADTTAQAAVGHSHYMYDKWLDAALLPLLRGELSRPEPRKLVILHTIGSHWWFPAHYTEEFARYKPELATRNISQATREEIVNSYDNTVLYTDWFLSQVLGALRNENAVMLYVADHGEGLGEEGGYLHGAPNSGTKQPAALVGWSGRFAARYPGKVQALTANRLREENTGFLFHTILDCADISTPAMQPERSMAR